MKISFIKTGVAMAALVVAGGAFAATETQTFNPTSFAAGSGVTYNFNLFDTMGGTRVLTGVSYSFSSDASGYLKLDNDNGTSTNFTAGSAVGYTLKSAAALGNITYINGSLASGRLVLGEATYSLAADDGDTTTLQESGDDYVLITGSDTLGKSGSVSAGLLSSYVGSGTSFWTLATTSGSSIIADTTNYQAAAAATASGLFTITYTYTEVPVTAVPEPESYAMLLAGLAAVGAVARRRRIQG